MPPKALRTDQTPDARDRWISRARRGSTPAFAQLQQRVVKHKASILAAIEHAWAIALIESGNTKSRFITGIALGLASVDSLVTLVMLSLCGHRPSLPGPRLENAQART